MKSMSKNAIIGYPAGIITGITYGLNPLFGMPLMNEGVAGVSILFFRYFFAVLLLGGFLLLKGERFKVSGKQMAILCLLGLLYTSSSIFLFEAYKYTTVSVATLSYYFAPVLVMVVSPILFKEKLSILEIIKTI